MDIKAAENENDYLKCWKVIKELRPHLTESEYLSMMNEMKSEGYRLAYIEDGGIAASAIGFRYLQFMFNGKHFYIDDLVTLPEHRGKGYGGLLLEYVFDLAKRKGYKTVTLDSGHHRYPAHRLYLNKGFDIQSHHFVKKF
jgi:GNAT superfamily N-acetyltransferase